MFGFCLFINCMDIGVIEKNEWCCGCGNSEEVIGWILYYFIVCVFDFFVYVFFLLRNS